MHTTALGECHLCAGMNIKPGCHFTAETYISNILHNHRIDTGARNRLKACFRRRKLIAENQRVEGHISFHPVPVQVPHDLGQALDFEIGRAVARVEAVEAEINRVGARGNSGAHGIEITGRRQYFRTISSHGSGPPRAIGRLAQVSFFNG